jgi:hypothetical protein
MRKIAAIVVGFGMVVSMAACGGGSGSSTSSFCKKAKELNSDKSLSSIGNSQDPKQIQADLDKATKAVDDLKSKAPSEIQADMNKVADGIHQFAAELKRVNGDFTKIDPSKFEQLNSQDFQSASDRVDKFAQDKCGISLNDSSSTTTP